MSAAAKFRVELLSALPPSDAARLIEALPEAVFAETLSAMSSGQLSEILPWMGEFERQRAMHAIPPLILRNAHKRMPGATREILKGSISLSIWDDIAKVKESEIKAWAHELACGLPNDAWQLWSDLDPESRARVALAMTDFQLGSIVEILK